MTPTRGKGGSIFRRPWVRNSLAVLTLMVLLLFCGWIYLDAVRVSNLQKIGEYRQLLGAETAAELWAKTIEERDPALFQLHGVSLLNDLSLIRDQISDDQSSISLSDDQLRELLTLVRQSPVAKAPEHVELALASPLPSILEIRLLIEACCRSGDDTRNMAIADKLDSDQERWLIGVELAESLGSGGLMIHEMIRTALLMMLLERGTELLGTLDLASLDRAESALARIELPWQGMARALQIETMWQSEGDLMDYWGATWYLSLDFQCFLDRQIPISLDPTDPALQQKYIEDPPFYAYITKIFVPNIANCMDSVRSVDVQLRALRSAFAATAARIRGVEWQPPDGVELIETSDGSPPRIHITGAPVETDIYLPR